MAENEHRASGCLFGLAFGDSLGADTEFDTVDGILRRYPPDGPQELPGRSATDGDSEIARVTDDTQMALAVGEALLDLAGHYEPAAVEKALIDAFVVWYRSPDNTPDRAPGTTCMAACKSLSREMPWQEASVLRSKGCGANMRVAPVGLLKGVSQSQRSGIAQKQAALTHGNATALAASDLTAFAVAYLYQGGKPDTLVEELEQYAQSQSGVYHAEWLGDFWKRPGVSSPAEFISAGWQECLAILDRLKMALKVQDRRSDPCKITGDGWVADEAFGTGMLCFLLFDDNPLSAIRRAVVSSGDSDSIAAVTGAFAGAHAGMVWPEDWLARIEYRERLDRLGSAWD